MIESIINWQIESIRFTAFGNNLLNPNMLETWLENVSANSPSQINKTSSSFTGVSKISTGFLHTNWAANRLDVMLSSERPHGNQVIGSISEVNTLFGLAVDRIPEIGELALIDRLALGLTLSFPVSSESEGIRILTPIIVGMNLSQSAKDFLYRVNHPCNSTTVDNLKINRLATWSVGKLQLIRLKVSKDGAQEQQTVSESPPSIRLELDINTDEAVHLQADLHELKCLLEELKAIALNIAHDGEVNMQK